MKKLFICFLLCVISSFAMCQNMLNDGGLDDNKNCPIECGTQSMNYTLAHNTNFWKSTYGYSVYMHYCGDTTICPPRVWHGIPYNFMGYQYPLSDSGYAAVYTGIGFTTSFTRGFVYQKMRQNLSVGQKYWVEYYTSLGDSANYAVKSMGATFTMDTLVYHIPSNTTTFNRPFKLENQGEYITDKVRWTQLSWIYQADSTYQTFLMGYAKDVPGFVGDTVFVGSECNWCNNNKYSFYYLENAGVFPIISNNQNIQVCGFPQTLQGPVGTDITYREWNIGGSSPSKTVYGPGTYTLTWRTDTTVHIDTFFVDATLPISNFLGGDTVSIAVGGSVVLNGPQGYAYLWNNNQTTQSITATTPGIYWLRITNNSGCNRYDSIVVRYDTTVNYDKQIEQWKENEVEVFPNPAFTIIQFKSREAREKINVQVFASDGKLLKELDFYSFTTLDVSDYNSGIYFVKFSSSNKLKLPLVKRFVKR